MTAPTVVPGPHTQLTIEFVCPQCNAAVSEKAAKCTACDAVFTDPRGWHPLPKDAPKPGSVLRIKARWHAHAFLVAVLALMAPIWLWIATALLPVFIRVLLPYPEAQDAVLYTGTIRYERSPNEFLTPSIYRIETQQGTHRIYCGYLMHRTDCGNLNDDGARGRVWYTALHGVVQLDIETSTGERRVSPREDFRRAYVDHFNWSRYYKDMLLLAFVTGYIAYRVLTWRRLLRDFDRAADNASRTVGG